MDVDCPRMACNSIIFQQGFMRGKSDVCCRVNFTIFSFIPVYSPGSNYYIGQAGVFDDRFARWQVYRTSSKPVRTYTSRTHSFGRVPQCVLGSQIFLEHWFPRACFHGAPSLPPEPSPNSVFVWTRGFEFGQLSLPLFSYNLATKSARLLGGSLSSICSIAATA